MKMLFYLQTYYFTMYSYIDYIIQCARHTQTSKVTNEAVKYNFIYTELRERDKMTPTHLWVLKQF